jgi:hypothetical protein
MLGMSSPWRKSQLYLQDTDQLPTIYSLSKEIPSRLGSYNVYTGIQADTQPEKLAPGIRLVDYSANPLLKSSKLI